MIKFHILRNLSGCSPEEIYHNYKKMTPGQSGIWGDIQATLNPKEADIFVVFGRIPEPDECPKERTIIIGREPRCWPGHVNLYGLEGYYGVYWHDMGNCYLPVLWGVSYDYDQLIDLSDPIKKTKEISTIISNKRSMPGHLYRLDFVAEFCRQYPSIDVYGYGGSMMPTSANTFGYIVNKDLGNIDYQFSIGVENCQSSGYFSGKLIDIMLLWGIPIYWGAPDIHEYFSVLKSSHELGSVIIIPDGDTSVAVEYVIQQMMLIKQDETLRALVLDAISDARQLVLNKYQFWPTLERIIQNKS